MISLTNYSKIALLYPTKRIVNPSVFGLYGIAGYNESLASNLFHEAGIHVIIEMI